MGIQMEIKLQFCITLLPIFYWGKIIIHYISFRKSEIVHMVDVVNDLPMPIHTMADTRIQIY